MEKENFIIVTDRLTIESIFEGILRRNLNQQNTDHSIEADKMDRKQAAKFLGVSYSTMYLWVRDGVLTEYGLNRKKYFLRSELIEAMQNNS